VTFVDNGDGTGTLSGTPSAAAAGSYALTFTATNSEGSSPTQNFTLTVGTPPAITSASAITFTVGITGSFIVTTSGLPAPSIARGGVALPSGVTFVDNGDGTGTLAGAPDSAGSATLIFTATNVVGSSAPQSFTLTIEPAPPTAGASTLGGQARTNTAPITPAASVTANVGALPAGKKVTILFDVLIVDPLPLGISQLSNQGAVAATGFDAVLTDDPRKPGTADPTITFVGARRIFMPLMSKNTSPPLSDLVVGGITASGSNVEIIIRNAGTQAVTDPFWVDLYINPATAPTRVNQVWSDVGTRGAAWGVVGSALPLEPGEILTLSVGDAYYRPPNSNPGGPIVAGTPLYAQVDSYNPGSSFGVVLETHERDAGPYNNILRATATSAALARYTPPAAAPAPGEAGLPAR
jgi:hypothetical protein